MPPVTVDLVIDTDAVTGKHLVHKKGSQAVFPPITRPVLQAGTVVTWQNLIQSQNELTLVFPEWANSVFLPAPRVQKVSFGATAQRTCVTPIPGNMKKRQKYMGYDSTTLLLIEGGSDPDVDVK